MDIKDFLIDEDTSMIEAMSQLDLVAKKILFVTKNDKFVATITDGDIRRWILKKGNLDANVRDIANYSPKTMLIENKNKAKDYMKINEIEALPIIDNDNNIRFLTQRMWKKTQCRSNFIISLHSPCHLSNLLLIK